MVASTAMKRRLILIVGCASLGLSLLTGCYSTVEGRTKAGLPFSKDRIDSRYERPLDQVFGAAKDVLKFNGTLEGENTISKTLWAKVDTRTVWVKVEEAEPKITSVTVQARTKGGVADIEDARDLIRPLQKLARLHEVPAFIVRDARVDDADEEQGAVFDLGKKLLRTLPPERP